MNYKEIVDNLKLEDIKRILDKIQVPYREIDNGLVMPTVCHNSNVEEASWKLYYYEDNHIFYCYTECSRAYSVFTFLKQFYTTRQIDFDWFEDVYNLVLNNSSFSPKEGFQSKYESIGDRYKRKVPKQLNTYPKGILEIFVKHYPVEWLNDGISERTMDKFNICFSISQNKIIIPHYNINNELVGIRGRALNEWEIENVGKYMPVKIEDKWYTHPLSVNLYGLNQTKENIKDSGICFIGESEKFVLQMESFERKNCSAAVCGSQFNKFQLNILMKHCHPKEICLCFDSEELEKEEKYFNKLYNMCKKYSNYCSMSFIYDRERLLKLKDSPTDHGQEIFEKLLEKRVRVK